MAGDPYAALGLKKTATDAEIKKAYRKIAKTDHPDLNPDPAATARFKAASSAYDLLKDPEKRRRFDAGEIDDQGQERPQRHYYREHAEAADNPYSRSYGFEGDPDLSDVFSDLFGRRGAGGSGAGGGGGFGGFRSSGYENPRDFHVRGQDYRFNLEIDFMTAARGGKTRISLPEGGDLEVTIPKGVRDGQTIRLKGKGGPGMGQGGSGDAYLTVTIAPHPDFRREGNDIFLTLPVTIYEATLGGKVPVPTVDGTVNLTIPQGSNTGRKLRLKGRGINGGDQTVELQVVMPPKVDDELTEFMEKWSKDHHYDPRSELKAGV